MSETNKKIIDGVIQLEEFDPSTLSSLEVDNSYLYATDDGSGNTIPALATTSGTGYLFPSASKTGIILTDASGIQWEIGISTSGTFTSASGTW